MPGSRRRVVLSKTLFIYRAVRPACHRNVSMIQIAALIFFPALMVWAAVSDMMTMKISNKVSLALLILYMFMAIVTGQSWADIGYHLACGGLVLLITFSMFAFGWIGGGDAKLAAATAIWFGFADVMAYVVVAAAFGGLLTLFLLQFRRFSLPEFLTKQAWIARLHSPTTGIPYGIALAGAGLYLYTETAIWQAAI